MEYTAKGALQTPLQQARGVGGGADMLSPSQLVYSRDDLAIVNINILKCGIHTNIYIENLAHTALICSYEYNNVDQATHVLSLLTNGVQDVLPRL